MGALRRTWSAASPPMPMRSRLRRNKHKLISRGGYNYEAVCSFGGLVEQDLLPVLTPRSYADPHFHCKQVENMPDHNGYEEWKLYTYKKADVQGEVVLAVTSRFVQNRTLSRIAN